MSNNAKLGLGTILKRGDGGAPEVFTKVPEMLTTPEIGLENPLVDVTFSDALAKEYIPGIPDGMELEFTFNYDSSNAQHAGLIADCQNKANRNFQVQVPAASTKTLSFTLASLKWSLEPNWEKQIILHYKGKISGAVVIS